MVSDACADLNKALPELTVAGDPGGVAAGGEEAPWSQKDDAGTEREQMPPSAVYRQLDDHLGPEEAPYDAESGLQRLRGWMG